MNSNSLMLRSSKWEVLPSTVINYALWCCSELRVDITRRADNPSAILICIQRTPFTDIYQAFECLNSILCKARSITTLKLYVQIADRLVANAIVERVLAASNVRLEALYIRRRYVGQRFGSLVPLIKAHAESLRVIGKLGLSEAIEAFDERIRLTRLSLINFDLIHNDEMESESLCLQTRFFLRRLAGLGATFEHLSYTTYSGFALTKSPAAQLLRACQVNSLRLTMQKGVALEDPPLIRPLSHTLEHIELVGAQLEFQTRNLDQLFPRLKSFVHRCQDLATGGASLPSGEQGVRSDEEELLRRPHLLSTSSNMSLGASPTSMLNANSLPEEQAEELLHQHFAVQAC